MSVQQVYVALFGRPADPAGLAYWNGVTNNGQNLAEMLRVLPSLTEYTSRFAGMDNAQIITTIYQNLFGRAPDAAGLAHFQSALASGSQNIATIAVNILQGAKGEDKQDVDNKVAAANLFTAALDTPEEIAAYNGTNAANIARQFLSKVDANAPATQETVNQAAGQVQSGQAPDQGGGVGGGGGGGGGVPPIVSPAAELTNGTLAVTKNANSSITFDGTDFIVSANGHTSLRFKADSVDKIAITAGKVLDIDAVALAAMKTNGVTLLGDGKANVQVSGLLSAFPTNPDTLPDITFLRWEGQASTSAVAKNLLVNGTVEQAFLLAWAEQNQLYYSSHVQGSAAIPQVLTTNQLGVKIANDYVAYLNAGGAAIDLAVQSRLYDVGSGLYVPDAARAQTFHDNVLSNLDDTLIGWRYANEAEAGRTIEAQAFGDRPYFDGRSGKLEDASKALAWDTANAIDRADTLQNYPTTEKFVLAKADNDPHGTGLGNFDLVERYDTIDAAVQAALASNGASNIVVKPNGDKVIVGGRAGETLTGGAKNDFIWGDNPADSARDPAIYGDDQINAGAGTNVIVLGNKSQNMKLGGQDTITHDFKAGGVDVVYNFNFGPVDRYDSLTVAGAAGTNVGPAGTNADLTFDKMVFQNADTPVRIWVGQSQDAYEMPTDLVTGGVSITNHQFSAFGNNVYTGNTSNLELVLQVGSSKVVFANAFSKWEVGGIMNKLNPNNPIDIANTTEAQMFAKLNEALSSDVTAGLVELSNPAYKQALIGFLAEQGNFSGLIA